MNLAQELAADPYRGYAYGYPHKTAYGPLRPEVSLRRAWAGEARDALTLYVHVPLCEMRCGFCNLFTLRGQGADFEDSYLAALERQAARVMGCLPGARFRAAALGGGTPTQLSVRGLRRLLALLAGLGADARVVPVSVETSPRTADAERLDVLSEAGVRRISIGVQSFAEQDTRVLGRPQKRAWVEAALERVRARSFPVLNLDLIYGAEGQSERGFLDSLDAALGYEPEELYLYPLYVRPLTSLGRRGPLSPAADARTALYRAARERLLSSGYEQISMRFFRRPGVDASADTCCQEDGTVGLGAGARSYTRALHYAFEWAVSQDAISSIVRAYVEAPEPSFDYARHGVWLSDEEQRRRYVIKTLLRKDGVPLSRYAGYFGSEALSDLKELGALLDAGLAALEGGALRLTERGLELSDAIGPYLYSATMRRRMDRYELR